MNPKQLQSSLPLALILIFALASSAQQPSKGSAHVYPHELDGFLLRQDRSAIEAELGAPFNQNKSPSGAMAYAYHLHNSKKNYLIAYYEKDKVYELELTGEEESEPTGFFDLQLGDSGEKVKAKLGQPTTISHEDDVNVDLWDYKKENYSLEFSPNGHLYSIQIVDEDKGIPGDFPGDKFTYGFAQAVQSHDLNEVMRLASGEIECASDDSLGIQAGSARKILSDRTSPISICLAKAATAILALGPAMNGTGDSIRLWPDVHRSGAVTKFPESSALKEVVFVVEAGNWRVYEVTFREAAPSLNKPSAVPAI
ncbi:MAG TPA: hypothetical protein VHZ52_03910 [Acidobacteriaceae bacterium]|nr:hypothetical protein [Acidobacteriaceae bacterium]